MKNYTIKLLLFFGLIVSFSCEDYLDIAPESELDQTDVFSNFDSAQGFVEEMYALVVDYGTSGHTFQDYLYGDDAHGNRTWKASYLIDNGNLNGLRTANYSYLTSWKNATYGTNNASTNQSNASRRPGLWDGSLKGIRNANIVIESQDLMIGLSQAEKDVILGQAYFFRAFFHNEIMKFWGRFPYIDKVLVGDFALPRPATYKESALAANEDYKKAIELLPVDWDNMPYGQKTLGDNKLRLTKGAAYAFQGKNLLLAASPLMYGNNGAMNTYQYDVELANMAVDAFAGVLNLTDQGRYRLASNLDEYKEVFWKTPTANVYPGSTELIFCAPGGDATTAQRFMTSGMDRDIHGQSGSEISSPTHNFINNNFGMANGLSIEDDMSGVYGPTLYNPNKPFENRDPRFYQWIVVDGDVFGTKASIPAKHKKAQLFTGGEHRSNGSDNQPSTTGYMRKKFYPVVDGEFHSKWNRIIDKYMGALLHMRLTDVYLMYAEALHVAKGSTTAPASYNLTAVDAINLLRTRAGIPNVHPSIVSDNNKFMDELRRERSVELSFEAHRWVDIRRWGLAHLDKYKRKLALEFPQDHSSFTERLLVERVCEYPKHYWIPFEAKQTQIYEGFPQNPGW
ncbi:RagB/SusD family nutrient uptake outer membrane protein [Lutibacter sp. A64]|uniref:RagB/SusD family nutrient uptake outer membrane protein n=1 Tax=Lutibacter sp. A64 TaxID=2918526 RepID=UPI001F06EC39|nr:RagB/SusD family nutrient uptake outer membrane protein [Lutibacter sp. A64]UMB54130.1 RagB/SusD family nutrient uptake outer membrane protein [Lutibacter sp. A64]